MVSLISTQSVTAETNLFRSLVKKIVIREGTSGGIIGLAEILADILSRLVRELTGQCKEIGLEHLQRTRGTFMQAQEALELLLENGNDSLDVGRSARKFQELSRRFEIELGQVCRYGSANKRQQQLYRAELKSTLHRLLDTVTRIATVE